MVQCAPQSMAKLQKNALLSKKFTKFAVVIVKAYSQERKAEWDAFVEASRNATFLLRRDYMDYHAHRFADASLMLYEGERLTALLPASAHGAEIRSHGGLTYGGLVMPYAGRFTAMTAIEAIEAIKAHYAAQGFERMTYKAIPHIYHRYPSEEDIYALWRAGAELAECNVSSAIDLAEPIPFNENARRNLRKSRGVKVTETTDFAPFWQVLAAMLRERYDAAPVHTLDEITMLHSRFPENIRLICAERAGEVLAGTVLYFCGPCVHTQYIAASPEGKLCGALPAVMAHAIAMSEGARYFDFGTCNEDRGRYLNAGLISQKNGFGGRAVAYPALSLNLKKHDN